MNTESEQKTRSSKQLAKALIHFLLQQEDAVSVALTVQGADIEQWAGKSFKTLWSGLPDTFLSIWEQQGTRTQLNVNVTPKYTSVFWATGRPVTYTVQTSQHKVDIGGLDVVTQITERKCFDVSRFMGLLTSHKEFEILKSIDVLPTAHSYLVNCDTLLTIRNLSGPRQKKRQCFTLSGADLLALESMNRLTDTSYLLWASNPVSCMVRQTDLALYTSELVLADEDESGKTEDIAVHLPAHKDEEIRLVYKGFETKMPFTRITSEVQLSQFLLHTGM